MRPLGWWPATALTIVLAGWMPAWSHGPDGSEPQPPAAPPETPEAPPQADDPVMHIQMLPQEEVFFRPTDEIGIRQFAWVKGIRFLVPPRCELERRENPMRLAQMRIKAIPDSGHDDALLVMFADIGGSVEDNIVRWVSQFRDIQGTPTQQDLLLKKDFLRITELKVTGTYNSAPPGSPEPTWKPDTSMYAAIVEGGPEGTVYLKLVGPKQTMAARHGAWQRIIRNLRVVPKPERLPGTGPAPADPANPVPEQAPPADPAPDADKEP